MALPHVFLMFPQPVSDPRRRAVLHENKFTPRGQLKVSARMADTDRGARARQGGAAGQVAGQGQGADGGAGGGGGGTVARSPRPRTHPPHPPPAGMVFPPSMGLPGVGYHPPPPPPPPPAFFPGSASLFEQLDKRVMVGSACSRTLLPNYVAKDMSE